MTARKKQAIVPPDNSASKCLLAVLKQAKSPTRQLSQQVHVSTPEASQIDTTESKLVESLTSANKQIVAGLARQNLPKCHPDILW